MTALLRRRIFPRGPRVRALMLSGFTLITFVSLPGQLFTGLGHLPNHNQNYASGLSDDGRVVVGTSLLVDSPSLPPRESRAYRWTANTGLTLLPMHLPNETGSGTYVISGDGATIVTWVSTSDSSLHAFRLRGAGPPTNLGDLPGGEHQTRGDDISADGTLIAGSAWGANGVRPILWTEQSRLIPLDPQAGTSGPNYASGITRDGTVVIGYGHSALTTSTTGSFRWSEQTGMVSLDRPGDHGSIVSSISDDGNIIIGHSGLAPLRWTPATGLAPLPFDERLGAPAEIVPTDLTGDGSLIVGWASKDRGETSSAVLWDRDDRMWLLDTLLPQLGFDLDGWSLTRAISISGDGRYIVGEGIHDGLYESYLLDFGPDGFTPIPEPSTYGIAALLVGLVAVGRRCVSRRRREGWS